MRLIDADALKENMFYHTADNVMYAEERDIDTMPTIDAVSVVRCKECVHRDPEDHRCDCGGHEWVIGKIVPVEDDWFCADGKRKDGESDGET